MGHEVVLFHSVLGLRPAVRDFADELRQAGHEVHTPDLFDGETFDDYAAGERKRDTMGIPELMTRAQAAVAELPAELVYAGFSMGTGAAEFLATHRPGARGAILMHGGLPLAALGLERWPAGVALQLHHAAEDPWIQTPVLETLAREAGGERFVYPGKGHLFADAGLPEYDASSAALMLDRVKAFLNALR